MVEFTRAIPHLFTIHWPLGTVPFMAGTYRFRMEYCEGRWECAIEDHGGKWWPIDGEWIPPAAQAPRRRDTAAKGALLPPPE